MTRADLTPALLRIALREIMNESARSIDFTAGAIGLYPVVLRGWFNAPPDPNPIIDPLVERYLAEYASRPHLIMRPMNKKTCPDCLEWLPVTDFYKYGKYSQCKTCHRALVKANTERKKQAARDEMAATA